MAEHVKIIVVNFDDKGAFESATKLVAGVVGDDGVEVPQPNVPVTADEVKKLLG